MKKIKLKQEVYALIDDEDFDFISKFSWRANIIQGITYAVGQIKKNDKWNRVYMHRIIMNPRKEMQIDHINGDGLDNRRKNLRLSTNQQNHFNIGRYKNNISGFKGVIKQGNRWRAQARFNGKMVYLGSYRSKEDAANTYIDFCKKNHGEFLKKKE